MEKLRKECDSSSGYFGLPCNLLPIHSEDHMLPQILGPLRPTFESYTDGGTSGFAATYYLRALSTYGLKGHAEKLVLELNRGFADGKITGALGSGHEFYSWDGVATGYEGTLIVCLGPLYAMAIERGILEPNEPEWWPSI